MKERLNPLNDFAYIPLEEFHTSFHLYEDRHKEYMLTDALELHFLDMVKFRRQPEKDIQHDPLQRWLVYFDKHSPIDLIEEVLRMDPAIQEMQDKIERLQGDPELFRAYLRYEKAASDEVTRINGARREGRQEGRQEEKLGIASKMKKVHFLLTKSRRIPGFPLRKLQGYKRGVKSTTRFEKANAFALGNYTRATSFTFPAAEIR
jgi:predicted transposase/invertase (TIGR01784 family)